MAYFPPSGTSIVKEAPRGYHAAIVLILLLSLWLRGAFPITAFGGAVHDDQLFVRMAASIGSGNWLGNYDNLTHAKGAAYSLFLLANHGTGLPVKISEHFLYLLAALFFSIIIGRVYATRWAVIASFVLLAFTPTAWNPETGGRIVREGLYVSLSLFLIALAAHCLVMNKSVSVAEEFREKRLSLVLLGLTGGFYWLTREEGVWLLPSIAILALFWLWSRPPALCMWKTKVLFMALPLIPFVLIVGTVNSLNYYKYGVFRNNDFRSTDFQLAYGALSRIKHDQWERYVVFPRDARERAYRFSPAVRELQPYFEGPLGEAWRVGGCRQTGINPCPEILSGWFMWALRDAVSAAGHYRSAEVAQLFYVRLAAEVNAACDSHPGECLPHRQSMTPPWRPHYLLDTVRTSWQVFETLVTLRGVPEGVGVSTGTSEQLALFAKVTNGPLAPSAPSVPSAGIAEQTTHSKVSPRDLVRFKLATYLATAERTICTIGVPLALIAWLLWLVMAVRRRKLDAGLVVASALVVALGARVVLLAYLEATSIPSNNMLYLFPVVPMTLALIPTVLFGIINFFRK